MFCFVFVFGFYAKFILDSSTRKSTYISKLDNVQEWECECHSLISWILMLLFFIYHNLLSSFSSIILRNTIFAHCLSLFLFIHYLFYLYFNNLFSLTRSHAIFKSRLFMCSENSNTVFVCEYVLKQTNEKKY